MGEVRTEAQSFYEENAWRSNTDLWIYLGSLEPQSMDSFNTVLYNLTIVLHDVYKKCAYYKYSKLETPILSLMSIMIDEMSQRVKDVPDTVDTMIDKNLQSYNPENRPKISEYVDQIEDPILVKEDFDKATKLITPLSSPLVIPTLENVPYMNGAQ
jgi:hypothetical protein